MALRTDPAQQLLVEDQKSLRALARGLLRDSHAAEDVVQDTWLVAATAPQPHDNPRAWLRAVTRNLALRRLRTSDRRRKREWATAHSDHLPSTAETAEAIEMRRILLDAVASLDEPYLSTIVLRYLDGIPPRTIARREQLPVKTVKTRLARGLHQLRQKLDHTHGKRRAWAMPLGSVAWPRQAVAAATTSALPAIGGVALALKMIVAAVVVAGVCLGVWTLTGRQRTVPASAASESATSSGKHSVKSESQDPKAPTATANGDELEERAKGPTLLTRRIPEQAPGVDPDDPDPCGKDIWSASQEPSPKVVAALADRLIHSNEECLKSLPSAWKQALMSSLCAAEPDLAFNPAFSRRLATDVAALLVSEIKAGPAGLNATADLFPCLGELLAGSSIADARVLGGLLRTYVGTLSGKDALEIPGVAGLFRALLSLDPSERLDWWKELWLSTKSEDRGSSRAWEAFLEVLDEHHPTLIVAFVKESAVWFEYAGSPATGRYLIASGDRIAARLKRADFTRELLLDAPSAVRLVMLWGIPGELRYPSTETPVLADAVPRDHLVDLLLRDMADDPAGQSWQANVAANIVSFLGPRMAVSIMEGVFGKGIDATVATHKQFILGALQSLDGAIESATIYENHPSPRVQDIAAGFRATAELLEDLLVRIAKKSTDENLLAVFEHLRSLAGMAPPFKRRAEKFRLLVGAERAASIGVKADPGK